jgi:hypothetical protein
VRQLARGEPFAFSPYPCILNIKLKVASMPYGVSAMAPDGAVSFRRKTPAGALETAMELKGLGLKEVGITFKGQKYTPLDLYASAWKRVPSADSDGSS